MSYEYASFILAAILISFLMEYSIAAPVSLPGRKTLSADVDGATSHLQEIRERTDEDFLLESQTEHSRFLSKSGVPDRIYPKDECKDGDDYVECDWTKFEECDEDQFLCYYRIPREDGEFYDRSERLPKFYIDYDVAQCVPRWNKDKNRPWNCNMCEPGRFCKRTGHCMFSRDADRYCKSGKGRESETTESDTTESETTESEERKQKRREERRKRREERRKRREERRKKKEEDEWW